MGGDAHLDPVERPSVVDDAAAGLGEPVRGDRVGRTVGWGTRTAEHDHPEQRRVDPGQGCCHQRHGGRAVSRRLLRGGRVEAVVDDQAGPGGECPRHHAQAADVRERQAGQPGVGGGQAESLAGGRGAGAHGGVGEHDALGRARRAARRHDQCVVRLRVDATAELVAAVRVDDRRRPQLVEQADARRRREPTVERQRGVAVVPDPAQGVDERRAAGQFDGDDAGHAPPLPARAHPDSATHRQTRHRRRHPRPAVRRLPTRAVGGGVTQCST